MKHESFEILEGFMTHLLFRLQEFTLELAQNWKHDI